MTRGRPLDLAGQRFGRLVAVGTTRLPSGGRAWECRCDCGAVCVVATGSLRSGNTKSCGCLQRDRARERLAVDNPGFSNGNQARLMHGFARRMQAHPLYSTWYGMRQRCNYEGHPDYRYYGGLGIRVCDRWDGPHGFAHFLQDIGSKPTPAHTLDRIDNDGNYEPNNCRWATPKQQAANRRRRGTA